MRDGVLDARAITFHGPGIPGRWAYSRFNEGCRVCGTRIQREKQGEDQRSTYWCSQCQV